MWCGGQGVVVVVVVDVDVDVVVVGRVVVVVVAGRVVVVVVAGRVVVVVVAGRVVVVVVVFGLPDPVWCRFDRTGRVVEVVALPRVVVVAATVVVVATELDVVAPGIEVVGAALPMPPPAAANTQASTPAQTTRTGKPTRARSRGERFFELLVLLAPTPVAAPAPAPAAAPRATAGPAFDGGGPAGVLGRFGLGDRVDFWALAEVADRGDGAAEGFGTAAGPEPALVEPPPASP